MKIEKDGEVTSFSPPSGNWWWLNPSHTAHAMSQLNLCFFRSPFKVNPTMKTWKQVIQQKLATLIDKLYVYPKVQHYMTNVTQAVKLLTN